MRKLLIGLVAALGVSSASGIPDGSTQPRGIEGDWFISTVVTCKGEPAEDGLEVSDIKTGLRVGLGDLSISASNGSLEFRFVGAGREFPDYRGYTGYSFRSFGYRAGGIDLDIQEALLTFDGSHSAYMHILLNIQTMPRTGDPNWMNCYFRYTRTSGR